MNNEQLMSPLCGRLFNNIANDPTKLNLDKKFQNIFYFLFFLYYFQLVWENRSSFIIHCSLFIVHYHSRSSFIVNLKKGDVFMRKNNKNITKKLPMSNNAKRGFRVYTAVVLVITFAFMLSVTAFANNDPLKTINNLSDFIFSLIRAIGLILLGFGIVQVGMSLKSHDPSQRANGFLTLAGGILIFFAKEILNLITK